MPLCLTPPFSIGLFRANSECSNMYELLSPSLLKCWDDRHAPQGLVSVMSNIDGTQGFAHAKWASADCPAAPGYILSYFSLNMLSPKDAKPCVCPPEAKTLANGSRRAS